MYEPRGCAPPVRRRRAVPAQAKRFITVPAEMLRVQLRVPCRGRVGAMTQRFLERMPGATRITLIRRRAGSDSRKAKVGRRLPRTRVPRVTRTAPVTRGALVSPVSRGVGGMTDEGPNGGVTGSAVTGSAVTGAAGSVTGSDGAGVTETAICASSELRISLTARTVTVSGPPGPSAAVYRTPAGSATAVPSSPPLASIDVAGRLRWRP